MFCSITPIAIRPFARVQHPLVALRPARPAAPTPSAEDQTQKIVGWTIIPLVSWVMSASDSIEGVSHFIKVVVAVSGELGHSTNHHHTLNDISKSVHNSNHNMLLVAMNYLNPSKYYVSIRQNFCTCTLIMGKPLQTDRGQPYTDKLSWLNVAHCLHSKAL